MRHCHGTNRANRCPRCTLPPRWCICEGMEPLDAGVAVDILMHERESLRPSSTGHLLGRVVKDLRTHIWDAGRMPGWEEIQRPDAELWILHPQGEALPAAPTDKRVQVLLIDGSWKQSAQMMKSVRGHGRRVRLEMAGESRFWLRGQSNEGRFSTAEALIGLLGALGLQAQHEALRRMFELHVYAMLCARGEKTQAAEYLQHSPIAAAHPELIARLSHCSRDERDRRWAMERGEDLA